jgi:hypothetical protein
VKPTRNQPLEHETPVVPETHATIKDEQPDSAPSPPGTDRDGSTAGSEESTGGQVEETYPEAPTGSAGHP